MTCETGGGPTSRFFGGIGEELGATQVRWSLSRLDLFCDVQGWVLDGDDRKRFVTRAQRRQLHEEGEALTGLEFGRRKGKQVCARIYDKTAQIEAKGLDWWYEVWGEAFNVKQPVLRTEFEIGRAGLKEFGVDTPRDGLARAAGIWAGLTEDWLTLRTRTADATRSRWPIAPEWAAIQRASLATGAAGLARVRAGQHKGDLRLILPALIGYLANVGAAFGLEDLPSTLGAARRLVEADEDERGIPFGARIAEKTRIRRSL